MPPVVTPMQCGSLFEVTISHPIRFNTIIHDEIAKGVFLIVELQIVNLTSSKYTNLFEEDYQIRGLVNGKETTFPASFSASFDLYFDGDNLIFFTDDILPGYPFSTAVAFDVDPSGTNWALLFQPNSQTGSPDCSLTIPLQ